MEGDTGDGREGVIAVVDFLHKKKNITIRNICIVAIRNISIVTMTKHVIMICVKTVPFMCPRGMSLLGRRQWGICALSSRWSRCHTT